MSDFKRLKIPPLKDANIFIDFEMEEYNRNIFNYRPREYFDFTILETDPNIKKLYTSLILKENLLKEFLKDNKLKLIKNI